MKLHALRVLSALFGLPIGLIGLGMIRDDLLLAYPTSPNIVDAVYGFAIISTVVFYVPKLFGYLREVIYSLVVPHESGKEDTATKRIAGATGLVVIAGICLIVFLLHFDYKLHADAMAPGETVGKFLGTYGDFFGGVLNPILTFFTFLALVLTMVMQRIQLHDAKLSAIVGERLSRQQTFETTFFNLLNLHNNTVQDLRFDPRAVTVAYEDVDESSEWPDHPDSAPLNRPAPYVGRAVFSEVLHTLDRKSYVEQGFGPIDVYRTIQTDHNHVLGRYFRNLYQILEFIEEYAPSDICGPDSKPKPPGKRYADMVRAQLSSDELILLFYNCSATIEDFGKFRKLVKKYELLEHMSLRFDKKTMLLHVAGYSFNIKYELNQYFQSSSEGTIETAGAFGTNLEVERYLNEPRNCSPATSSQGSLAAK